LSRHDLVELAKNTAEGLFLVMLGVVIGRYLTLLEYETIIVRLRLQHEEMETLDDGVSSQEDNKKSGKTRFKVED